MTGAFPLRMPNGICMMGVFFLQTWLDGALTCSLQHQGGRSTIAVAMSAPTSIFYFLHRAAFFVLNPPGGGASPLRMPRGLRGYLRWYPRVVASDLLQI